ncbi:MAG TPA: 4-hydroxyphenylacetate 3-hydroxylase N-terminal domain-containing protein, partial [bacterium]|nr:4-hydroxyphenylacetate 3-hydroxylase N-terminal domain-containing protein [bacterium]
MPLRSPEAFLESLRDGRRVIYRGQGVPDVTVHPHLGRGAAHVAVDFRLAHERPADPLFVDRDAPDRPASRYFTIPRTTADLVRRRDLIEAVTREARSFVPIVKEIGTDALFALMIVTAGMARTLGTPYHERVRACYDRCRDGDLAMAVAQTDAKGDRSRRPAEQANPDAYVRRV